MSKRVTRIGLAVLISLAVIIGLYSTVLGASDEASARAGSHLVSGAKVNLDHYREANPAPAPLQSEIRPGGGHGGGGCEYEGFSNPDL